MASSSSCMTAEPRGLVRNFKLYQTQSMFYLVGRDKSQATWQVLKIDRSEPTSLSLVEDPTRYTAAQFADLLRRIDSGSTATGGLSLVTKCYGVVGFVKFLGPYYMVLITRRSKIGTICGHDVFSVDKSDIIPILSPSVLPNVANSGDEKRYMSLFRAVNLSKDFFFSYSYKIMHSLQKNVANKNSSESQYETSFVWNEFLTQGIRQHIKNPIWTVPLVHGFFRQEKLSVSGKDFCLTVIARRSCHFAGPRFMKRGVDEKGNVANDVETEQIVYVDTQDENPPQITSLVQHRGSIPLFWFQEMSKLPIKPDILLQPDEDYKAAHLHFENLMTRYRNPTIVLNLIKIVEKKPRESLLRLELSKAIDHINERLSGDKQIMFLHIDMKNYSRSGEVLPFLVSVGSAALRQTEILHCQINPTSKSEDTTCKESDVTCSSDIINCMDPHSGAMDVVPLSLQKGVVRTNCIDCLDRTNGAQFACGLAAFSHQLHALGLIEVPEIGIDDPLSLTLMDLYEQMGDALAIQYTGSAAQNKLFWKQRGQWCVISRFQELVRTIQRFVSNAYMDSEKQNALNVFLGRFQPEQGKPALWRLGSANIHTSQETPNNEDNGRSFQKSVSSGLICPGKAIESYTANSELLSGTMELDGTREDSDSDLETPVCQAGQSSSSCNSSTLQGRHLIAEGQTCLRGSQYHDLCSSNFLDLDNLLSPASSSQMNSHGSAASGHSDEFYREQGQTGEGLEKTPLLHKNRPISKLSDFSSQFAQWVAHNPLLCR